MATTPRKKGNGYEIQVCVNGVRKSTIKKTKALCRMWALEMEKELRQEKVSGVVDKTLSDLLVRYGDTVSVNKRGKEQEMWRIGALCRDEIGKVQLKDLDASTLSQWRDRRLRQVSSGTVIRDWILLSHAMTIAITEWGWMKENPLKNIKRPSPPKPRTRLMTDEEIETLLYTMGYDYNKHPYTIMARTGAALLFSLETAMRAGEVANLTWPNVNLENRVAHISHSKNGFSRDVPLTKEAIRILQQVRTDNIYVFNLKSSQIESAFIKAKQRSLIKDLHYHDSRANAITKLSQKVDILTLARISGHRDLKMLQVYYRESMEDIAKRI